MKYRRDVDGLRALAVLPVIFFHAGFEIFSGGFIGVDIFFVISGYLITTIILAEKEANTFSIVNFYERRARRILPALFLVMAICLPPAWQWLMPSDFKEFAQSLSAVSIFASNILFWKTSGYFESAAELKPLLHTWSLAVEEQYYLLFPLFIITTWSIGKKWMVTILTIIAFLSLLLAHWGAKHLPLATFFLLPTRIWELLIGSLIAFYFARKEFKLQSHCVNNTASLIGLSFIVYSIFFFNKHTPFPSFYALIPCIGAALIILFSTPQTIVGKILGFKIFVGVGLISYSTYLWHQPLFAFARQISVTEELKTSIYIGLIILTLGLAYLTWLLVEQPFRNKKKVNRKIIFTFATTGTLVFGAIGLTGNQANGFDSRFKGIPELAKIDSAYEYFDHKAMLRRDICHTVKLETLETNNCIDIRKTNIFIWGDSYAAMLYSGLEIVRNKKHQTYGITQVTDDNGPPFFTEGVTDDEKTLIEANTNRLSLVEKYQPEIVIISWMIGGYNGIRDKDLAFEELKKTTDKIFKASPKSRIVIVGPVPKWKGSLIKQMIEYFQKNGRYAPKYMHRGLVENDIEWDVAMKEKIPKEKISYVSAYDALCNASGCLTRTGPNALDITAIDWGHLSKSGSLYLAEKIEKQVFN